MSQKKRLSAIMGAPVQASEPGTADAYSSKVYAHVAAATPTPERRSSPTRSMAAMWAASRASPEPGEAVVELDPSLCEPSAIADRIPDATDAAFDAFVEQIRDEGQHTPILVRPHPKQQGRYEIAYGRRRTQAATTIGRPVRAIVRDLSDAELVVAQGSENLSRADLSYIERAHFARNMDQAGIAKDVILRAMGVHRPDLANYLMVAEAIPAPILAMIGPAPKVGRPRWLTLVERIKAATRARIEAALASPDLAAKTSDERFAVLLAGLSATPQRKTRPMAQTVTDSKGVKFARVERNATGLRVTVEDKIEPGFGDYLADRLPEILAAYRAAKD